MINTWGVLLDGYQSKFVREVAGGIKEKAYFEVGKSKRYTKKNGGSYIHKCHDEPVTRKEYEKKSSFWANLRVGSKHKLIVDLFQSGRTIEKITIEADVERRYVREILIRRGLIEKQIKNNKKSVIVHKETEGLS